MKDRNSLTRQPLGVLSMLLLITPGVTFGAIRQFLCLGPSCGCMEEVAGNDISLMINCGFTDMSFNVSMIDKLLRDWKNVTKLDINSCGPLTTIPPSICHMSGLKSLNLDRNNLVEIPGGCLVGLPNLTVFSAIRNGIAFLSADESVNSLQTKNLSQLTKVLLDYNSLERFPDNWFAHMPNVKELSVTYNSLVELQDGVFDGLENLWKIVLDQNAIATIGPRVFSAASGLRSLTQIEMSYNHLQTLDTWIFERGRLGKDGKTVNIVLKENPVTNFSNELNWKFNCDDLQFHLNVYLINNKVKHLSDAIKAWALDWSTCISTVAKICIVGQKLPCDCSDYDYFSRFPSAGKRWLFETDSDCNAENVFCRITDQCPPECSSCIYRPLNATMYIECSASNLTHVPSVLPPLSTFEGNPKYSIDISKNSHLKRLENRKYYALASLFDISSSGLESIDAGAIASLLTSARTVRLNGNRLKVLPSNLSSLEIVTETLNITDNPWLCSCANLWMINWLNKMKTRLTNPDDILCDSPSSMYRRSIIRLTHDDVCVDKFARSTYIAVTISISSFVAIFIVITVIVVTAHRLRYALFARYGLHLFDRDECENEEVEYDVFLCCSEEDELALGDHILDEIESKGYKVCYDRRDFELGNLTITNVSRAVERSKRTVCLVSQNFISW
jgi:Leucine-rich repeat (LRR) protein